MNKTFPGSDVQPLEEGYLITLGTNGHQYYVDEEGVVSIYNPSEVPEGITVGAYVDYVPNTDSFTMPAEQTGCDEVQTLTTNTDIKWKYLGKDDNGNILLISDKATSDTVKFNGVNGYNNAVNLIDDACNTLYANQYGTARNLKIEEIETRLSDFQSVLDKSFQNLGAAVRYGEPFEVTGENQYPTIYEQEKGGFIDSKPTAGTLGMSDKASGVITGYKITKESLKATQTVWSSGGLTEIDFTDSKDMSALLNSGNFWLSSRGVSTNSQDTPNHIDFYLKVVIGNAVGGHYLCLSNGIDSQAEAETPAYGLRPVIVLNAGVDIVEGTGTGASGTITNPYRIQ